VYIFAAKANPDLASQAQKILAPYFFGLEGKYVLPGIRPL
jgi:hypothetical protein